MNLPYLDSDAGYARFIQEFEQGTLPRAQWTHAAHLAVAAWYLVTLREHEALDRMRSGIQHYNECVGSRNTPDRISRDVDPVLAGDGGGISQTRRCVPEPSGTGPGCGGRVWGAARPVPEILQF